MIGRVTGLNSTRNVRLVKGSHIVVPKFWEGRHAYLVQNSDKRVIFINPYENDLALIGTTDIPYEGRPEEVAADDGEIDYLLRVVNRYFKRQLARDDVMHSFSGVRPLYDDNADNPSAVTRDYIFELDAPDGQAPLLSIFGGKITTFRKLSEHALEKIAAFLPEDGEGLDGQRAPARRRHAGRRISNSSWATLHDGLSVDAGRRSPSIMRGVYGTRARMCVGGAKSLADLGRRFGPDFYEPRRPICSRTNGPLTAADMLERRTKHGLHMSADERTSFDDWCSGRLAKAG